MSIRRATAIPLMRRAVDKGQSRTSFLRELRAKGLTYRKTSMLADWRGITQIERKKEVFQYVRKDRLPTSRAIAEVPWKLSTEFKYMVKIQSRLRPDEPIKTEVKAVMQDELITPARAEELAWEMIREQSPKRIGEIVSITAWHVQQRVLD